MNSTKCDECGDIKPLDELVRKQNVRSFYVCTPCKTEQLEAEYDPFNVGHNNKFPLRATRIHKLLGWCLG